MARIALDAMGGDHAPTETVAGAVEAWGRGVDLVLVGREENIRRELDLYNVTIPIVDAPDVIGMGDDPARALRERPYASISVAARLVADGSAQGFVSAGSTGAAMAAAAIVVGRIPGVSRPAIASIFPTPGAPTVLLDSGANPEVKPQQLVQFAVMGSVTARTVLGVANPRVGLLSNGEEKSKGRDLERAAHDLLERSPVEFVGNVEGHDLVTGKADVIVTDGFTGNIFLKSTEGAARLALGWLERAFSQLPAEVQEKASGALAAVREQIDYETYGGAQLLGVKAVVVIAHGSSSRVAIANALVLAREAADHDLPRLLAQHLAE